MCASDGRVFALVKLWLTRSSKGLAAQVPQQFPAALPSHCCIAGGLASFTYTRAVCRCVYVCSCYFLCVCVSVCVCVFASVCVMFFVVLKCVFVLVS